MNEIKFLLLCLLLFLYEINANNAHATTKVTHYIEDSIIPPHNKCQSITVQFCLGIQYNETILPNLLGHTTQHEAALEVNQYFPLLKINCSPDLQFFLCSVYFPVCTILENALPPCRSLCLNAKTGCESIMQQFGYQWPEALDCEKFPETSVSDNLCVGEKKPLVVPPSTSNPNGLLNNNNNNHHPNHHLNNLDMPAWHGKNFGFVCPEQFKVPNHLDYKFKVGDKTEENCGAPCHMMFFNKQKKQFARVWVGIWAILCCISCLFTVSTFLIDKERFRYPERPIIFLSICYFMVAFAYLIGFLFGDMIACQDLYPMSEQQQGLKVSTITQGTKYESCTILFMILYFFSMASSIWWIVLTLTWFLAAGLKWGHEAIEANSQYFHLAAWALPAIQTIIILALGKVDGDILSGVCFVGIWDAEAMRVFILLPLVVYLIMGTIFLSSGFVSLFRIRTVMKHEGTKTEKLEKLMIRIGIFSVLYIVPALIVIGCLFYEHIYFNDWIKTWWSDICHNPTYSIPCPISSFTEEKQVKSYPRFEAFMLKYLMTMIVGITSSVWIWSGFGKTVHSWKVFFNSLQRRRNVEAYV